MNARYLIMLMVWGSLGCLLGLHGSAVSGQPEPKHGKKDEKKASFPPPVPPAFKEPDVKSDPKEKAAAEAWAKQAEINWIDYDPTSTTILTSDVARNVRVWNARTGEHLRTLKFPAWHLLTVSPDGKFVFTNGKADGVCIGDLATGEQVGELEATFSYVRSFAWAPNGQLLTGDGTGMVRVWDVAGRKLVREFKAYDLQVTAMRFLDNGQLFTAGTRVHESVFNGTVTLRTREDDYLKTWDPAGKLVTTHGAKGHALAFAPGRRCFYVQEQHGRSIAVEDEPPATWEVVQLDLASMKEGKRVKDSSPYLAAASPDGRLLALVSGGKLQLHDTATDRLIRVLPGWDVNALAFAPNGRQVVGGGKGTLKLLDLPLKEWTASLASPGRNRLWADLTDDDMKAAYSAITQLAATPNETLADLEHLVRPRKPVVSADQLRRWIDELDAREFRVREAAEISLRKALIEAEAPLRSRLDSPQVSPEVRTRIQKLLADYRVPAFTGEDLQTARHLQLIEAIHTGAARALVERIAKGAPGHPVTDEASRILKRWPPTK